MLRKISFAAAILGIVLLFGYLEFSITEIDNAEDLEKLEINSKVSLEGKVEGYKNIGDIDIFYIKGIEIVYSYEKFEVKQLEGKNVKIKGTLEEYHSKKQIRLLEFEILS